MPWLKLGFWVCVLGLLAWFFWPPKSMDHPVGTQLTFAPQQTETQQPAFAIGDYTITPLADFVIEARILSRKNYSWDREADIAPIDLALGWGKMSDSLHLAGIDISQRGRWYHWRAHNMTLSPSEIESSSANMHIIPANKDILKQIRQFPLHAMIRLEGSLVRADGTHGWTWSSSLTRSDTGNHACELFYVTKVTRLK
jgi:hypothetical protein